MALGLAQILTGGVDIRDVPTVLTVSIGYGNVFGSVPIISVIALVVVVIGAIVLHYTRFGLYTLAVGSSEIAARRVGVKVDAQLIKIYTISGALAGLGGILSLSQFSTTAIAGQSQTNLNVIAAVVIGGTSLFGGVGTIMGTVVGLFIPPCCRTASSSPACSPSGSRSPSARSSSPRSTSTRCAAPQPRAATRKASGASSSAEVGAAEPRRHPVPITTPHPDPRNGDHNEVEQEGDRT